MRRTMRWALLAGLAGWASLTVQANTGDPSKPPDPTAEAAKPASVTPGLVEVRFADNTAMKMTLAVSNLTVNTRFGKLSIPMESIRRIEFGLRYPAGVANQIEAAIAKLGDSNFRTRKAAANELLGHGELAYPYVQKATTSSDTEVAKAAADLAKTLAERLSPERLKVRDEDVIHTPGFTVVGRIELETIKAKTNYFGTVEFKLTIVRSLRAFGGREETQLTVEGAKYAVRTQENWLDTGRVVRAGSELAIAASGEVDLYPVGGEVNTYIGGPGGPVRWGGDPGQKMPHPPGTLLGRIGDTGPVFVVGAKYEGAAPREGKLYLRIAPSCWSPVPTGQYTVKILCEGN